MLVEQQKLREVDRQLKASARIMLGLQEQAAKEHPYQSHSGGSEGAAEWEVGSDGVVERPARHESYRPFAMVEAKGTDSD